MAETTETASVMAASTFSAFGRSMASTGPALRRLGHTFTVSFLGTRDRKRHRRRCSYCNPRGNPPPEAGKFKPGSKAARMRRR